MGTDTKQTASQECQSSKNPPTEPLLSGQAAVDLIGDAESSDVVLQVKTGEFVYAHSPYLFRNPYFASHRELLTGQNNSLSNPFKIDPPHPSEFRFVLNCIYANTPEYCEGRVFGQSFMPLLANAQFFQEKNLMTSCAAWFSQNWTTAIQHPEFNCRHIDQPTLAKLLAEFKDPVLDAKTKLHVILKWANEWREDDDCAQLRQFVESLVDFKNVASQDWVELSQQFDHGVDFCVAPRTHVYFAKNPVSPPIGNQMVQIKCHFCHQFIDCDKFWVANSCPKNRTYEPMGQHYTVYAQKKKVE
ncbi:hypothetical protein HDU98_003795 [Podochytrium sp. JEL0797]|nr:hypothetical protein HDU98_003795 [Podochytrium sp. JEL0797]